MRHLLDHSLGQEAVPLVGVTHPQTALAIPVDVFWNPLVPELTITGMAASLRFYQAIGFTVRYQREHPSFAYLELGQAQLMLEEEHPDGWNLVPLDRPRGRGINLQIEVPLIERVVEALHRMNVHLYREVRETWYAVSATQEEGQRELLVQDPDGYLLRFAEPLGTRCRGAIHP